MLRGVAWPVASVADAESLATRLGFERLLEMGHRWSQTARLENGALLWYAAGRDTSFRARAGSAVLPLFTGLPPGAIGGLPVGQWNAPEGKAMPHPNGAIELVRVTAVVASLDGACAAWERHGVKFGRRFTDPRHARPAREATLQDGRVVRFVAANSKAGAATDLALRWVGFTIAVNELKSASAHLRKSGVAVSCMDEAERPQRCRVDVGDVLGVEIELVPSSAGSPR